MAPVYKITANMENRTEQSRMCEKVVYKLEDSVLYKPAFSQLAAVRCRRHANGDRYQGRIETTDGTGQFSKPYNLTTHDFEHYCAELDPNFLQTLKNSQGRWISMPVGCVLESLAKALAYMGDHVGNQLVTADVVASLSTDDRMKYLAEQCKEWNYVPTKICGCPLHADPPDSPLVVQVARTHAVTVFKNLIFDSAYDHPLPLTQESLSACIGAEYKGGDHIRGYRLTLSHKARNKAQKKRLREETDCTVKVARLEE